MLHARGPLLSIDVGTRTVETHDIDSTLEAFIGGRGVATKLAHDRIPFDADPLGPANSAIFTAGPLQSAATSFTGRMNCTGISPLTGGLLSSNAGGFLSRNFTGTGNSAVEITGRSDDLVAIHVSDSGVEFESVPELEQATTSEVCAYMEDEHDLGPEHVASIGPAGENLVRYASIMTSERRAFGRGGLGAVLGAKHVKAVTFRGDAAPNIEFDDVTGDIHREAATSEHIMKSQGTTSVTALANDMNAFPTRYFSELSFEGAEHIGGEAVGEKKFRKATCSRCAFACKLPTRDEESGLETEGPEYETVMSFGGNTGVDDVVAVMQSNERCDQYGLDTISAGDVVAAYLAANDEFGNSDLVHELVEQIAYREGVGDSLAEGIDRIADDLGVENWSVKGMEFPAHDGRTLNGQGLGFAVSTRGADHMFSTFYSLEYPLVGKADAMNPAGLDGKPARLVERENLMAVNDSAILCKFSRDFVGMERLERLLEATRRELLAVGDDVVTLERHFNNQRGVDRDDDTLPYDIEGFDAACTEYYEIRGWDENGRVPEEAVP